MPVFEPSAVDIAANDPRYVAALTLVRRNGAREIQLRYDDEQNPIVWVAVAGFAVINNKISTHRSGKINAHQVGSGLDPLSAIFSLCRACLDRRGVCIHCHRNTMFEETFEPQPLADFYCWYQWDPEMKTFRRGCEGSV